MRWPWAGSPPSTDEARRDTERLLGAFTGQLLRELGAPDGAVAVEEHEHDIAFGSLPGGIRGEDRFLAGQSGAPLTIGRAGRAAAVRQAARTRARRCRQQAEVRLSKLFLDRRALIAGADVDAVVGAAERRGRPARQHRAAARAPAGAPLPLPARPDGRGAGRARAACATATTAAPRRTACSGAGGPTRRCAS